MTTNPNDLDFDMYGGAGNDTLTGGAGNDRGFGGAGDDVLDGAGGSDDVKAGSGNDTLIHNLSANAGATDIYTGGSGMDTVLLRLTQAQWTDTAVRAELQRYVEFLQAVKLNTQGEVSNGIESDFTFSFANGSRVTLQMIEKLAVAVQDSSGQYVVIDHLAAYISGASTAGVTEAGGVKNGSPGTPAATGDLYSDDLDGPDDLFQAVTAGTASIGGYGSYGVTAAGVWTYTLDNANAVVQALNNSHTVADSFYVTAADGSSQLVSITIQGTNDAAVITGTSTGAVIEAGGLANAIPGTPTATGDLLATDVDNTLDQFQAVAAGATTTNGYGTYELTAAGVWTYTLDNSNAAVQALNVSSTPLSDSFSVLSADGTSQLVTVTIDGTNDAAVITGTSAGTVIEAGGLANAIPGTPTATGDLLATDVDNTLDQFQAVAAGATTTNGYGTYELTAAGVWTYTLDNSNAAVQALDTGGSLSDSFTATTADGTAQWVSITIQGTTDITNVSPTNITLQAADVGNGLPAAGATIGTLSTTDADAGDIHTYSVPAGIFYIDGNNLRISSDLAPGSSYTVAVTTTDSVSTPYAKTFGVITGTAQPDDLAGTGNDDVLYGFNGADSLIYGGGGNDALFGQGNNDKLSGGDGDDLLNGGAGHDSLTGGGGNDVFRFSTNLSAANNVDTIVDFVSGSDQIHLENSGAGVFNALPSGALAAAAFDVVGAGAAADGNTRIIYDSTTGALSYDVDGTGATAAVQFAVVGITIHPSLAYTDFVVI